MTFKTYLRVFGSDDKKHDLERKFGYKFRALERVYPDASKLPDDEIQKAIDVFYDGDANENVETMVNRVKDYTAKNEPIWNEKYFNPKPKQAQMQPQEPNLMQKPKLKGFGDYMADVKQIGNKMWEKVTPHLPGYESGYLVGMVKPAIDHLGNMGDKNILEIGKQVKDISKDVIKYYPLGLNDKYKHAVINCRAAQRGQTAEDLVTYFARLKEFYDVNLKLENRNTMNESIKDSQANALGRSLGRLYKDGNCEEMVSKYINRNY